MVPDNDDGPSDPKKYRRTLLPLEFEDADPPPTIGKRLFNIFRKKGRAAGPEGKDEPASSSGSAEPDDSGRSDDSLP
jgi:hypothetical protein